MSVPLGQLPADFDAWRTDDERQGYRPPRRPAAEPDLVARLVKRVSAVRAAELTGPQGDDENDDSTFEQE